jgi:uncharacterized membrane protein YgcG
MRKTSSLLVSFTVSVSLIVCCAIVGFAQSRNREKFVISAKAGGINAITGQASVHGRGESDWQQLAITDDLDAGDRVRTANDGRVEILLNPGSYLRLGGDSEVELSNNSLENLEVRLLRGTAIVEATGADDLDLNINISTPHTRLAIVRHGLYRLNVVPENATELIVRKGRVILSDSHTKVKEGNKVVFNATNVSVAKLTKEEKKTSDAEDVAVWSKERGKMLAKANSHIDNGRLNSAFAMFSDLDPFSRDPFSRRNGLWVYNAGAHCYTFLPFYYGWSSPYGSYNTSIYYPPAYYPRPNGYTPQPAGSGGNGGGHNYPSSGSGSGGGGNHYPSGGSGGSSPRPAEPNPIVNRPEGGFGGGRERSPDAGRQPRVAPMRPDQ